MEKRRKRSTNHVARREMSGDVLVGGVVPNLSSIWLGGAVLNLSFIKGTCRLASIRLGACPPHHRHQDILLAAGAKQVEFPPPQHFPSISTEQFVRTGGAPNWKAPNLNVSLSARYSEEVSLFSALAKE